MDKPGQCYRKFAGCNPADDEDCLYCCHFGDWPEDWECAVERHEDEEA